MMSEAGRRPPDCDRRCVTIGTDSSALRAEGILAQGSPHPRSYGTFPRVLGKYVRDDKLMSIQEAVQRMTGAAAAQMGMRDRGLIRDRYLADLVVFNPATVKDTATYERPHQYPTGIEYVVVNGVVVLDPKGSDRRAAGPAPVWARASSHEVSPADRVCDGRGVLRASAFAAVGGFRSSAATRPTADKSAGQAATGRVTGTVKLTTANSSPSPATAYDRRAVGPRAKALPESRNVVIFFDGIPPRADVAADAGVDRAEGRTVRAARRGGDGGIVGGVSQRRSRSSITCSRCRAARRSISAAIPSGAAAREGVHAAPASSRCSARFTRT